MKGVRISTLFLQISLIIFGLFLNDKGHGDVVILFPPEWSDEHVRAMTIYAQEEGYRIIKVNGRPAVVVPGNTPAYQSTPKGLRPGFHGGRNYGGKKAVIGDRRRSFFTLGFGWALGDHCSGTNTWLSTTPISRVKNMSPYDTTIYFDPEIVSTYNTLNRREIFSPKLEDMHPQAPNPLRASEWRLRDLQRHFAPSVVAVEGKRFSLPLVPEDTVVPSYSPPRSTRSSGRRFSKLEVATSMIACNPAGHELAGDIGHGILRTIYPEDPNALSRREIVQEAMNHDETTWWEKTFYFIGAIIGGRPDTLF